MFSAQASAAATSPSARFMDCSPAGPARLWRGCLTGCAALTAFFQSTVVVTIVDPAVLALSRFDGGVGGGKQIRGVKLHVAVDKYASRSRSMSRQRTDMARRVGAGSASARRGWLPGPALGVLGYRGERLAKAGEGLGITVKAIARGHEGRSVPAAVCWVVEGFFRLGERLNTMFEELWRTTSSRSLRLPSSPSSLGTRSASNPQDLSA